MGAERVERRLAAILAADVAGYSRIMGQDEVGTLSRLRSHRREFIDPKIAEHRGRIVKTTGDGILAEFPSIVEAVACAVEFQQGMAERNAPIPNDERIDFRVGINLGDVIAEDNDIYGDGVNIAARLEALAAGTTFMPKSSHSRRKPNGSVPGPRAVASRLSLIILRWRLKLDWSGRGVSVGRRAGRAPAGGNPCR